MQITWVAEFIKKEMTSLSVRTLFPSTSYLSVSIVNVLGLCSSSAHPDPETNKWSEKRQQKSLRPILQSVPVVVYEAVSLRTRIRGTIGSVRSFSSMTGGGNMELVYTAPLKGSVRAIKVFSLTTAVATFFGGPILVWLGNPSVPLVARVMMSSVVMLVGLGTTALLHWLVKGYVMKMEYDREKENLAIHSLTLFARLKKYDVHISETGPPSKAIAFSTFQAKGKSFFMHTEVFQDRELLTRILGAFSVFEKEITSSGDGNAKEE